MATEPQGNQEKPRFGTSDRLIAMFRTYCSRDPTEAIKARLKRMLHTFLLHHRDNVGDEKTKALAAKCCCEAGLWYYTLLENVVDQERKRLDISDVSDLLENDLIQCCLVVCCLEIAICSNSLPCDFPLLLQILNMEPYHFWRVIELVLLAEARLPHNVVRHLAQVEDKVVESLAWTNKSPLWEEIRANMGHLPACHQVMSPTQLEDPTRTNMHPKPNVPGLPGSSGAGRPPTDENRPQRTRCLALFARKVYRLMGKRLRELCSILGISDELRFKIWTCFEYSLVHCTHLMVDHHLDQLLMCAIYIIAKITKAEIPFKHIMKCYKSQPHASKSVCNDVLISGGNVENSPTGNNNIGDHGNSLLTPNTPSTHYLGPIAEQRGNLIYFYNQVYTTKMQNYAKQFDLTSERDTPPLSAYPRQWKASLRRHQLSRGHSVYITPHNPETPTPRARGLCYYFNSSPPERLREINNMIRTGRSSNRRGYMVTLDEEEEDAEDAEDSPSAKRLCLDNQSAWQRRLRSVVNERVPRSNQGQQQHQSLLVKKSNLH